MPGKQIQYTKVDQETDTEKGAQRNIPPQQSSTILFDVNHWCDTEVDQETDTKKDTQKNTDAQEPVPNLFNVNYWRAQNEAGVSGVIGLCNIL